MRPNFVKDTKMKKNLKKWVLLLMAAITLPVTSMAQDKVELNANVDVVSSYIWRGQKLGNACLQTSVGVAYKGFSLSAWSPIAFDGKDADEIDLTLAYETGNFSVSLTDYWLTEIGDEHTLEAQLGYDFGFLNVRICILYFVDCSFLVDRSRLGSRSRCYTMGYRLLWHRQILGMRPQLGCIEGNQHLQVIQHYPLCKGYLQSYNRKVLRSRWYQLLNMNKV